MYSRRGVCASPFFEVLNMDFDDLINDCIEDSQEPPREGKRGAGRPNRGLSEICTKKRHEISKTLRTVTPPETFSPELVERVAGEVVDIKDVDQFLELYELTIESVKEQYFIEHPDNLKRPPHEWYAQLLYVCRDNLPQVDKNDITAVGGVWDIFCRLMSSIKLFPTREAFTNLTGIYKQTIDKRLSSEWVALCQKMTHDCESGLVNQVAFNTNTQINKLFLLKSVYGYREADTQKTIEVNHTIKKVDDIPLFGIENKEE